MTKTEIRFVAGFEPGFAVPAPVKAAGFAHRFAVIQETCRPDRADMYFDEALWLRLLDFAAHVSPGARVGILAREDGAEVGADVFLPAWSALDAADREPPAIMVRDFRNAPVLYIEPEYWTRIGGPMPYHDSYTYSIYSFDDVGGRVLRFLAAADAAAGWEMSSDVLEPKTRASWLARLRAWF